MKIFAISDLHLSTGCDKPMDIFGAHWTDYINKIETSWKENVSEEDVVLLAGDFSWAMDISTALLDFQIVSELPGKKVIIKGNHDYWWSTISKVKANLPPNFYAIQNDAVRIGKTVIFGTRGWTVPFGSDFAKEDEKIYKRELERLKLSIEDMKRTIKDGDEVIAITHFPPFNVYRENSEMTALFEESGVKKVVYGHLHGKDSRADKIVTKNGIRYYLTSCDLVDFELQLISEVK